MRLLFILPIVAIGTWAQKQSESTDAEAMQLYEDALSQLSALPDQYSGSEPVYTAENIQWGISVPQYDMETQDYVGKSAENRPHIPYEDALLTLTKASELGCLDATAALAEIYTFGNFSVPVNYTKARSYYQAVVTEKADANAYFMLGFMYSTGLFGEVSVDKQRAKIYYELAARSGDTNAILVLANQYLKGIDSAENCEMAQLYYSRLARQVMKHLEESEAKNYADVRMDVLRYNINVADFSGGLFGNKMSESRSSVLTTADWILRTRNKLREGNLDSPDSRILDYYFAAVEHFYDGYFAPRNATKAYSEASKCAYLGISEFSKDHSQNPSIIDKTLWAECQGLLGKMYLNGDGVERNLSRAFFWLNNTVNSNPSAENSLDMAILRSLDPTTHGSLSDSCTSYLINAVENGSAHGTFVYAKSLVAPRNPLETVYTESTYKKLSASASVGHYQSLFYVADGMDSGIAAQDGNFFTCEERSKFYKVFVQNSEFVLFPHLLYAFKELRYGNYKNALLGYSMAAEQGLMYSAISAATLLYQPATILSNRPAKHSPQRVQAAVKYLDVASLQGHIDSTIMLGDIYSKGIPGGLSPEYDKAFSYYSTAASLASPHACYKLGYMYEYGLGCANNSADYFKAKHYYDLSVKYYQDRNVNTGLKPNTYAIDFALLRLRLKYLFSNSEKRDTESLGWFGTLKKLAKSTDSETKDDKATSKAQANAEGETYNDQEDYQLFDYIVLIFTLAFFAYVGVQNLRGQFRRANPANPDHAEAPVRPRIQVEFFFAI